MLIFLDKQWLDAQMAMSPLKIGCYMYLLLDK